MQFDPTPIPGVLVISVDVQSDERGLFGRTFDAESFAAHGLPTVWPQCNTSWNRHRATLRGMHFQAHPRPEAKLVRCTRGRIYDVVVDLRPDSRCLYEWFALELSEENRKQLYVPAGCAHGFLTLDDGCEVFYMMSQIYVSELASGVRWNDPALSIAWPNEPVAMSKRDQTWQDLKPIPPRS